MIEIGENIVIWFSCGAASAVAAKETLDRYGDTHNITLVNNPVIEEDADNRRFLKDVEQWLGVRIETATNHRYPNCSAVEVWEKRGFMAGPHGAPCTLELKKHARYQYESDHDIDWHVLGFTLEEKHRFDRFVKNERPNTLPILINAQITKSDCYRILMEADLELPRSYRLGYPNGNCYGCPKASSPTYWNHVRRVHPDVFKARAQLSRKIGAKLVRVNNERIFLDQLDPLAVGRPMKSLDFECGIFCQTW